MREITILIIISITLVATLVAFGKITERKYTYILYGAALGLILSTTLAGPYLVGSDIHLEYYFLQLFHHKNVLPQQVYVPQGTNVFSYIMPSTIWTYKILYPIIYSFVPVLCYKLFKRWTTTKSAFFGTLLVVCFTPFFLEIPTIPRQITAEVSLLVALYLITVDTLNLKYKCLLLVTCGTLIPLSHYSTTVLTVIALTTCTLTAYLVNYKHKKLLLVLVSVILLTSCVYFSLAQGGIVRETLCTLWNRVTPQTLHVPEFEAPTPTTAKVPISSQTADIPQNTASTPETSLTKPKLEDYGILIPIVLGTNITNPATWVYLSLAWLVAILAALGFWKHRRDEEFKVLSAGFIVPLLLCSIPAFVTALNLTRIIHFSTLMLAFLPFSRLKSSRLMLGITLPILFFNSGAAFEMLKIPDVSTISLPYNYSLSNYRIDLGATTTPEDYVVRDYIVENSLYPVFADIYGCGLLEEAVGPTGSRTDLLNMLPSEPRKLPNGYVFVRSRNTEDRALATWAGIGCRKCYSLDDWRLDFQHDIVFQCGDAYVLRTPDWDSTKKEGLKNGNRLFSGRLQVS